MMFYLTGIRSTLSVIAFTAIFAVLLRESNACDCSAAETRVVCGSNGLSYQNLCRLNCAKTIVPGLTKIGNGYCGPGDYESLCHCPTTFTLICGSNGRNYLSDCHLECDKRRYPALKKLKDGVCSLREFFSPGTPIADCNCPKTSKPLCGTDGVTYSNRCHLECGQKLNPDLTILAEISCWFIDKLKITESVNLNGTNSTHGSPLEQGLEALGLPPVTEEKGNEIKKNITEFFRPLTDNIPPAIKNIGKKNTTDNSTRSNSEESVADLMKTAKPAKHDVRITPDDVDHPEKGMEAVGVKKPAHEKPGHEKPGHEKAKNPTVKPTHLPTTRAMHDITHGYEGAK